MYKCIEFHTSVPKLQGDIQRSNNLYLIKALFVVPVLNNCTENDFKSSLLKELCRLFLTTQVQNYRRRAHNHLNYYATIRAQNYPIMLALCSMHALAYIPTMLEIMQHRPIIT